VAVFGDCLVNLLLTISIKVNLPVGDMSRILTTGDDHEVQKGERWPWAPELASGLWLGRRWRQRLIGIRPNKPDFRRIMDDLRLGADRLSACACIIGNPARAQD
jgi:hypothetical protein